MTCEKSNPWADGVKQALRKQVTQRLLDEALKLPAAMKEKDIDEERLAQKKAEAAAAEKGYKEAEEKSGEAKKAIAEERKQKEEEMKKAEAVKAASQP